MRNSGRRLLPLASFGWKVDAQFVGWLFLGVPRVMCGHSSTLTAWQKVMQGNFWWTGDRGEAEKLLDAHLAFPKSRAAGVTCKPREPGSTCSEFLQDVLPGGTYPYIHLTPDPAPGPTSAPNIAEGTGSLVPAVCVRLGSGSKSYT